MPSETGITSILGVEKQINKNQPNGYAGLDSSELIAPWITPKKAGTTVRNSHDALAYVLSTTFLLKKTITLDHHFKGSVNCYFELNCHIEPPYYSYYTSGYVNISGVHSPTRTATVEGWNLFDETFSNLDLPSGSTIELWIKAVDDIGDLTSGIAKNFRLRYDEDTGIIGTTNS